MRVGLVVLHAERGRGGAERYTLDLADALADRFGGDNVDVLASTFDGTGTWRRVVLPARAATRAGRYRAFCRSLDAALDERSYEVVHAMSAVPRCDVYHPHAGPAAIRTGSRIGWWANPRRRLLARLERSLLLGPRPPITLTLSGLVEAELRGAYPLLAADRTARLFNAVDLTRFGEAVDPLPRASMGLAPDDVAALFVANNFALKGLPQLLVAMAQHERLRLLVVGRDDPGAMRAAAERLGVAARVRWLGPRGDLPALYRTADVLVLPTRRDSCSLVVLEALASGLPVITTRANGAAEIMADGEHGFILDRHDDVPALAGALGALFDPSIRRRASEACLALRPDLSWDRHIERVFHIYAKITSDRG